MKGLIFNIKRYSIHDGPGIRVTIFMKGCPLSCNWCHNPEGISACQESVDKVEKVGNREFIVSEKVGKFYSVEEILSIIRRERIFIDESKGGVTFSGGEPFMQPEFLQEALKECREEGYHTAIDTSGYADPEIIKMILPFANLFLFDLKHTDNKNHIAFTGVSNQLILSNLKLIANAGKRIWIRIPVIPGVNDDKENLEMSKLLIQDLSRGNIEKITLLPYHRIGASKYDKFGIPYRMNGVEPPSRTRLNELREFFAGTGVKTKIGG